MFLKPMNEETTLKEFLETLEESGCDEFSIKNIPGLRGATDIELRIGNVNGGATLRVEGPAFTRILGRAPKDLITRQDAVKGPLDVVLGAYEDLVDP